MEIAMAAIGPLLPKLSDLLVGEFTLKKRVRKGIEALVTELTLMQAVLGKVAKVPAEQLDEGVKIWAVNVKELSYQMEDIVDAFIVGGEDGGEPVHPEHGIKKLLNKAIRLFKKARYFHQISGAIEEVVGQAKQLGELRQRYEQDMHDSGHGASVDPRLMALYTDVTELVGIEDTRDELINMLIEGDDWLKHPLKTVSVVGFGGLGKTTLVKAVYDKMKVQFDCGAFVSVSRNPDMKKILKDILFELDKDKYTNIYNVARGEKHLIDELIELLCDKRYLIIVDDIWDEKAWKLIKCAFSKNNLGSRLITTSRIVSVSEACCSSNDDIYRMEPLSNDVSRRLFYKRVFNHETGCPHELLQVSEDILKKCGGIPLAIITTASLLVSNHRVKTKDQWYALLNSIGRGLTEDPSAEEMKKILLFSYYDLSSYLKPCLLYLSIYPEDYKIIRDELIWRWIAEGFVESGKQETSLYELGKSYYNELINKSMIQRVEIDDEERIEACYVHDMVLDLICSLSSEENFVMILDGTKRKVPNSQSKVRRLSIQETKVDLATTRMPHVRSLTVYTQKNVDQVLLISSFQILRVLDLEGCSVLDIGCVVNLLHLRYLRLKDTHISELPTELGKLRFLQTLDLREAHHIRELPSSIVRLRHLVCLYVHIDMKLPSSMDNLTSLEVLVGVMVGGVSPHIFNLDIVKELSHLTKLRVLRIACCGLDYSQNKALVESVRNLHKVESLEIHIMRAWVPPHLCMPHFGEVASFKTLPSWINPLAFPLLSYLYLFVNEVQPEDLRLLGMLPALRYLSLMVGAGVIFSGEHVVEISSFTADAFPCAIECYFFSVGAVPSVFPQGAAPKLKRLRFSFPAIWMARGGFNMGMRHLPSLEKVEVHISGRGASTALVKRAEAALRAAADDHPNHPALPMF